MNDFLANLEIGENKVKLSKEEIKAILAEHGKSVKTETEKIENKYKEDIAQYKTTIDDLKQKIENAPKSEELENLKNTIADMEDKEQKRLAEEKAKKDDEILTNNIVSIIGDKKFTSEYAKNGLLSDIKSELKKDENQGKGIKDILEELTKDRTDIFENPNKMTDMAGMQDIDNVVSKESFEKMSYKERLDFKQSNPELFAKYNN